MTDERLNDLVEDFQSRRIDRRSFMQRAAALGIPAAAISAALGAQAGLARATSAFARSEIEEGGSMNPLPESAGLLARLSDDIAAAVERAGAGTVTVNARRRMPASGIVWREDGLIVTANHVVERDEEITIGLPDGREVSASLIGRDPGTDLALLKADGSDLSVAPRSPAPVKIGHLVLAVARPGPAGPMASFGGVSVVGGAWRTRQGRSVDGYVRADVAMLPGFSGGPLVNAEGLVVGLNSSTLGPGGLTVPVSAIEAVVDDLLAHGKVRRGFLGIGAQAVRVPANLARGLGLAQERGLLLVSVEPDSPAERDGLFLGDVIVALNDEPVGEVDELQDRLTGDWVGRPLPVRVIRGGQLRDVRVTVGERP